jgi:NADH:ubiquinone oxidoreductase subunit E
MAYKAPRIRVCMGSSCFSRGNSRNVEIIKTFLSAHNMRDPNGPGIEVVGTLCEGQCKEGPIVILDDKVYKHVTPTILPDLLEHHFFERG